MLLAWASRPSACLLLEGGSYNCGTKGEADFGIAPHFLGFLDPKSHVIWASRSGCDFIQSFYNQERADFDIAPI